MMSLAGRYEDEEAPYDPEPEPWRPPVQCPECFARQTRFLSLHHEVSVYECDLCGVRFEIEE